MKINHLKHNQINKQKWDSAIENAGNGLVYALSWYLDIVSPKWEALVVGDYEIVMPMTVKKKYGFKYLIQPPFCQQLGVFPKVSKRDIEDLILKNTIPSKFKFIAINLNFNLMNDSSEKTNFELVLSTDYKNIESKYSTNTKRNISKAKKQDLKIVENIPLIELWKFKKENPVNQISKSNYNKLMVLIDTAQRKGFGECYGVINSQSNLVGVMFLVNFNNRLTMLVSSSNKQGKENSAMFLLIDWIIKKYAGKKEIFDFEGGSISGLSRFFSGFGSVATKYYHFKQNTLMWPLNKL